jgi:hypothetical protein
MNNIFDVEADIAVVASSCAKNRQRKYQEFCIKY